jgi:membrane fusion protein, heavy metal efflux system
MSRDVTRRLTRAVFTMALASGCRATSGEKKDTGARAMADMPGMAASKDSVAEGGSRVSLSAAQIKNGRVKWEPAVVGTAAAAVMVPGQLVPNEDRTARLGAPASGRIVTVHVRPGDPVSVRVPLVTMVSPEAGAAQSDVSKAEAELTSRRAQAAYAKAARDRAERLLALKAIPRQDYERAVADDELARGALIQGEAELRRARSTAAQLGADASPNGEIVLRSPLAGVVLDRTALPGAVVEAGSALVVVTDPSTLWLTIDSPEALAAQFRVGAMVRFSVPAYGVESFAARVDAVGAGLSPDRRTLPVRATVANTSGRLKPEMFATVVVAAGASVPAVMVPDDAVQFLDGKMVVFLARPGNDSTTFVARPVEVGARSGGRVAIMRGVASGDLVVIAGAFAVKAQLKKGSMPMEM